MPILICGHAFGFKFSQSAEFKIPFRNLHRSIRFNEAVLIKDLINHVEFARAPIRCCVTPNLRRHRLRNSTASAVNRGFINRSPAVTVFAVNQLAAPIIAAELADKETGVNRAHLIKRPARD